MPYIKTLLFTIVAPGTVAGVIPYYFITGIEVFAFSMGMFRFLGLVFMAVGFVGYLWCGFDFAHRGQGTPAPIDPPKKLIIVGLYKYVRNPMYVSIGSLLIGETIFFENAVILAYMLCLWLIFHSFVVLYEEPTLKKLFGSEYEQYCKEVSRWIPNL